MKQKIITFLILTLFIAAPLKVFSADPTAGQAKYQMFCVTCHGASGMGDGPGAVALNPKPRNLKITKTDAEMKNVIKNGGAAAGLAVTMPAWGAMIPDADIDNIIAYIRSLK